MNSLRARLVGFILLAVGAVWLATAVIVWNEAHRELHELVNALPPAVRADLEHDRREVVKEVAEHLAKPILIAFPLLAVLLVIAVTLALRPLQRLAREVAARAPERLEPLALAGAPSEVKPLIDRLNRLFADIARALENERRFTADAAHELRTPLAALKAQAQVALGTTDDADRGHALRQIIAGCDRSTHLVEQLLTLARLDAPRQSGFVTVDLRALAAETLAEFAGIAVDRGSTLSLDESSAPSVRGDPLLLSVALRNLVGNALWHSPPGSSVEVSVHRVGERIAIAVDDNGPGIAEDERAHVMQRFRRGADTSAPGSGLGLSIARRIAELHGGELRLEGKPGAGGDRVSGAAKVSPGGTVASMLLPLDRAGTGPP